MSSERQLAEDELEHWRTYSGNRVLFLGSRKRLQNPKTPGRYALLVPFVK